MAMLTACVRPDPARMDWRRRPVTIRQGRGWVDLTLAISQPGLWHGPCCYAFLVNGVVVYVGSTSNLGCRLYQHRANLLARLWQELGHGLDIQLKVNTGSRHGDWAMRELRLIRRLRPRYNTKMR